jgi:hypothetical protein
MTDAQEQKVVGADGYVASMREALDAALGKPPTSVAPPGTEQRSGMSGC